MISPSLRCENGRVVFLGEWSKTIEERERQDLFVRASALEFESSVLVDVRGAFLDSWGESVVEDIVSKVLRSGGRVAVIADDAANTILLRRRLNRWTRVIITSVLAEAESHVESV